MKMIEMIKLDIKVMLIQKSKEEALDDILRLRNFLNALEDIYREEEDGNKETDSKN